MIDHFYLPNSRENVQKFRKAQNWRELTGESKIDNSQFYELRLSPVWWTSEKLNHNNNVLPIPAATTDHGHHTLVSVKKRRIKTVLLCRTSVSQRQCWKLPGSTLEFFKHATQNFLSHYTQNYTEGKNYLKYYKAEKSQRQAQNSDCQCARCQ